MLNETGAGINPELALPMGRIRVPKFLYLVVIVLSVLILAVIGLNMYLTKNINKLVNNKISQNEASKKLSNMEIAQMSLDWVKRQKDDRGVFYMGTKCNSLQECDPPIDTNRSGFSVLWAENKYVLKTNDVETLKNMEETIAAYTNRKTVKELNNNFWNCYFIKQVWDNEKLSQKTRDNLEKICFDSSYELSYIITIGTVDDRKEKVGVLVDSILAQGVNIEKQIKPLNVPDEGLLENTRENMYFFVAADRMTKYLWKNNEKDLYDSMIDLESSLDFYKNNQPEVKAYEGCETGVSTLLAYSVFKEQKYIDLAKMIFNQQIKKINPDSLKDKAVCGILANNIYEQTKDENVLKEKKQILDDVRANNFDMNEGGFYYKDNDWMIKNIKYNGVLTGLFLDNK